VAESTPNFRAILAKRPRARADAIIVGVGVNEDKHHWYEVQITVEIIAGDPYVWSFKQTYADFKELHKKIKDILEERKGKVGIKITFPPDPVFQVHSEKFLQERVHLLQNYTKDVYATEPTNTDFNNFIHWDEEMEKATSQLTLEWQNKYLEFLKGNGPKPVLSEKLGDLRLYVNFQLL